MLYQPKTNFLNVSPRSDFQILYVLYPGKNRTNTEDYLYDLLLSVWPLWVSVSAANRNIIHEGQMCINEMISACEPTDVVFSSYNAGICLHKPWGPMGFFNLKSYWMF